MKITIDGTAYTRIKQLSFAPQTDIVGSQLPINQFSADIMTSNDISTGGLAYLYDDRDNLWAKYWLVTVERKDKQTLHVEAVSFIELLERTAMTAHYYSSELFSDIVASIFYNITTRISGNNYYIDSSIASKRITGFAPNQTARELLLWICFVAGAYVKTAFTDKIEILPIPLVDQLIPMDKTFWKPTVAYSDYVTAVKAIAYSYTLGTPQTTDKWVQDGNDYYIQTEQEFTLSNPEAPATAQENVVEIKGLTLINTGNVSDILTRISTYYFKRMEVSADVINNADYEPGDKVILCTDDETLVSGYICEASFSFGLQARSKIKLAQTDSVDGSSLVIIALYNDQEIGRQSYNLPIGYAYDIQNPYIDLMRSNVRVIYRPLNTSASGTVVEGGTVDTEDYDMALRLESGHLFIYSVDEINQRDERVSIT